MLGLNDYIQLSVGIFSFVPVYILLSYYRKTKLSEFLFFGLTFLVGSINQFNGVLKRQGYMGENGEIIAGLTVLGIYLFYGMMVNQFKYEKFFN